MSIFYPFFNLRNLSYLIYLLTAPMGRQQEEKEKERKRLTKQRTCQTRSPSERIIPCNGRVILRAVLKIHGLSEKIH